MVRHHNPWIVLWFKTGKIPEKFLAFILRVFCLCLRAYRFAELSELSCLEDHPRTCMWLITLVIVSPLRIGLFPFQIAFLWLIHGGDPNHLLNGMILQVSPSERFPVQGLILLTGPTASRLQAFISRTFQCWRSKHGLGPQATCSVQKSGLCCQHAWPAGWFDHGLCDCHWQGVVDAHFTIGHCLWMLVAERICFQQGMIPCQIFEGCPLGGSFETASGYIKVLIRARFCPVETLFWGATELVDAGRLLCRPAAGQKLQQFKNNMHQNGKCWPCSRPSLLTRLRWIRKWHCGRKTPQLHHLHGKGDPPKPTFPPPKK